MLPKRTSLKEINLDCNGICDAGVGSLAEILQRCSSLKELNLRGNDYGGEAQKRLEAAAQASRVALVQDREYSRDVTPNFYW